MALAVVDKTAHVADDVTLGENTFLGAGVSVGRGSRIGHGVVIYPNTILGEKVTVYDNAVLGRKPQGTGTLLRPFKENLSPLRIEEGCVVGACAVLYLGTSIGAETLIGDLASIREECLIGRRVVIGRGVTVNYNTRIGEGTKVMDNAHLTGDMIIEQDVFIGPLVATTNDKSMGRDPDLARKRGGPHIKRRASIGAGAILHPNVVIGEYAMVAAGAVVHLEVAPRTIVAGNPARVVKDVPAEWLAPEKTG